MGKKKLAKHSLKEIVTQSTRMMILKSINSRENASTFAEISDDLGMSSGCLWSHLSILVARKILYKQPNYITGRGHFYSFYWSDNAQEAVAMIEAAV